jgi:hypothetical protein
MTPKEFLKSYVEKFNSDKRKPQEDSARMDEKKLSLRPLQLVS